MIALVVLALMTGAALGVILGGTLRAGRREDECRACRREHSADPERRDGTE